MTLSVNTSTPTSQIGISQGDGKGENPAEAFLIAQNKAFIKESEKSEAESEKRIADARKEFMKQRAKMMAANVSSSPLSRDAAQSASTALLEGGESTGAIIIPTLDEPSASMNTPPILQGDMQNIRFTSGSEPKF